MKALNAKNGRKGTTEKNSVISKKGSQRIAQANSTAMNQTTAVASSTQTSAMPSTVNANNDPSATGENNPPEIEPENFIRRSNRLQTANRTRKYGAITYHQILPVTGANAQPTRAK